MISDHYYYHCLNEKNQIVYKKIYNSIIQFNPNVDVETAFSSVAELMMVIEAIRKDNPFLYFWNSEIVKVTPLDLYNSQVDLNYYLSNDKYIEIDSKVKVNAKKILSMIKAKDEYGIVTELHDILCSNILYDNNGISDNAQKIDEVTAHTMLGVILKKMAVCDGVAYAFKYLLNAMNIKCIVVTGKASSRISLSDSNDKLGHAWNIIKINGISSHFDLTWDIELSKGGIVTYDYFSLDDNSISKDHLWDDKLPACNDLSLNYYNINNLVFDDKRSIYKYVEKQLNCGIKQVDIKIDNMQEEIDNVADEVMDYLFKTSVGTGIKSFSQIINSEQRIIHYKFF